MEAEATVESKSWLKRFSHGRRFNLALELLELSGNERVLDYGTGEGFMLQRILDRHPQCRLVGYEPEPQEYAKLIKKMGDRRDSAHLSLIDNLDATTVRSFDVLCCLEVFEHLSDAHQQKALADLINFTADHGKIVISVPIETGISSLLKNTVRILLRQTHPNTTAKTVFYSLFGLKIMRGGGGGGGGGRTWPHRIRLSRSGKNADRCKIENHHQNLLPV